MIVMMSEEKEGCYKKRPKTKVCKEGRKKRYTLGEKDRKKGRSIYRRKTYRRKG